MSKETKESESAEELITKKQEDLIKELLVEINDFEVNVPPSYTNGAMKRKEASEYIDYLLGVKQAKNGETPKRVNGFDKISYSMIYKLVYKNWDNLSSYAAVNSKTFKEVVHEQYIDYLQARDYAKQEIAKGAAE